VSVLASESNSASASQAGAPAPGQTFCTSCGHRLATENRFCGWCGHVVG
jgi:hypothetical protein